jgi:hypothetical protein
MHATTVIVYALLAVLSGTLPLASAQAGGGAASEIKDDGWSAASPESTGLTTKTLSDMSSAIRAGEFKKISSILIARHGKLVFEDYFDGDTTLLRDTRSATKSITDALIGIAIDEKN